MVYISHDTKIGIIYSFHESAQTNCTIMSSYHNQITSLLALSKILLRIALGDNDAAIMSKHVNFWWNDLDYLLFYCWICIIAWLDEVVSCVYIAGFARLSRRQIRYFNIIFSFYSSGVDSPLFGHPFDVPNLQEDSYIWIKRADQNLFTSTFLLKD